MTLENFEDFHHNIQRKIQSDRYDLEKEVRMKPKTELRAAKLERLRKDLKERTGRDSNQAVLEYILELAWSEWLELDHDPQQELEELADTR